MIEKKLFTINEICNLKKSLQDLMALGFKNQKLSWDIAKLIKKLNSQLKTYDIAKKEIVKKFKKDNEELKKLELKEPKGDNTGAVSDSEMKKYKIDLLAHNILLSQLKSDVTKKVQELSKNEVEIGFKVIGYEFLCKNVEKIIQPQALVDLDWLIENEEVKKSEAPKVEEPKVEKVKKEEKK